MKCFRHKACLYDCVVCQGDYLRLLKYSLYWARANKSSQCAVFHNSVNRTYFASVILQCILFVWSTVIKFVLYIIWVHRSCYYRGCVLRHVLSVGRVQTHGEGKRRRLEEFGDCTTTEIRPLREQPGSLQSIRKSGTVWSWKVHYMTLSKLFMGEFPVRGYIHDASVGV